MWHRGRGCIGVAAGQGGGCLRAHKRKFNMTAIIKTHQTRLESLPASERREPGGRPVHVVKPYRGCLCLMACDDGSAGGRVDAGLFHRCCSGIASSHERIIIQATKSRRSSPPSLLQNSHDCEAVGAVPISSLPGHGALWVAVIAERCVCGGQHIESLEGTEPGSDWNDV